MSKKITELTANSTIVDTDQTVFVDVSDTTQSSTGTNKKTAWSLIKSTLKTYFDTQYIDLPTEGTSGQVLTTDGAGDYTWEDAASNIPASSTGTTITFTQDTLWNEATYLTSGNLTLDLTGAVKGTYAVVFCDSYEPAISGETYYVSSGAFNTSALNILSFFYDGTSIYLNIGNVSYLSAPTLTATAGNEEALISWSAITNADSYLVQRDTDSGFPSPTTAYNSTGTSFTDTGLTGGTTYYYRARATGNGFLTSAWSSTVNTTPVELSTSLVASYSFQTDASDYTTNNNGTEFNTPTHASAKVGNGVTLNGTTQYITLPDSNDFSFTDGAGTDTAYSISFWLNATAFSGVRDFLIKRDLSSNNEWQINFNGNVIQWRNFNNGGTAAYIENTFDVNSAASVTTGTWYHFVLTYDGSETASGMKVYINNTAYTAGQNTVGTYNGMINGTRDVFIGRRDGGSNYWAGSIDELHIWKGRELTATEVGVIYTNENAGTSIF